MHEMVKEGDKETMSTARTHSEQNIWIFLEIIFRNKKREKKQEKVCSSGYRQAHKVLVAYVP